MKPLVRYLALAVLVSLALAGRATTGVDSVIRIPSNAITLPETAARGGVVTLSRVPPYGATVAAATRAGEAPAAVAQRLAAAANADPEFHERNGHLTVRADGVQIDGLEGDPHSGIQALGGTGLTLPPTPSSLSVSYDIHRDRIVISWDNGSLAYTAVGVSVDANSIWLSEQPGDATTWELICFDRGRVLQNPLTDRMVAVVGYQGNTPSNAGVMRLRGSRQDEVYVLPFTDGVTPNWTPWRDRVEGAAVHFDEGRHAADKPERYQVLRGVGTGPESRFSFGLARKFFDLEPGGRYRLGLQTRFTAGPETAAHWLVAVLPVPERQQALTAGQMAAAELPAKARRLFGEDGTAQPPAAPWARQQTGAKEVADVVLPEGCRTLLVWVRLEGHGKGSATLGFDGLFLDRVPALRPQQQE